MAAGGDPDLLDIISLLAGLTGGDAGAAIQEAVKSGRTKKDDDGNPGADPDPDTDMAEVKGNIGKMLTSLTELTTLVKGELTGVKGELTTLKKSATSTEETVKKMAAQPGTSDISVRGAQPAAPAELTDTGKIEKATRVRTLQEKIRNTYDSRLKEQYIRELKEHDPVAEY